VQEAAPLALPWAPSPVVTVGSLRHGEEPLVLEAMGRLRERRPQVRFVLAPRHPARWPDLPAMLRARGFRTALRSAPATDDAGAGVLVLDTHGELGAAYAAAAVSLIGGTWIRVGGHNPLEAAVCGTPVVLGPHTANVAEETAALLEHGGARRAEGVAALVEILEHWLEDAAARDAASAGARAAAAGLRGASGRTLEWLLARGVLTGASDARP